MGKGLVIVTGCDSGIGEALCALLLDRGYDVAAGYFERTPAPIRERHHPFALDLRSEDSIRAFADAALALPSAELPLTAAVQNAAVVNALPFEDLPVELYRETFEVNFFGLASLTRKCVPALIRDRGRLVIVGSMAGRIGLPFFSPYVASKFALEGLCESLRKELAPFGVFTTIIEPGGIATPIWNRSWERIKRIYLPLVGERYRTVFERAAGNFVAGGNEGMEVGKAAGRIARELTRSRPRPRVIVSRRPWMERLETMLPTRLMDWLIGKLFRMDELKPEAVGRSRARGRSGKPGAP